MSAAPASMTTTASAQSDQADTPDTAPAEGPTYYPSVADIIDAGTAQAQGVRSQSTDVSDLTGLPDGTLVELQCKRIVGAGTQTIGGHTYKYLDIADDLPAQDTIRAYCTRDVSPNDRVNRVSGQVRYVDTTPVLCIDDGPGYDPQVLVGALTTVSPDTIAYVWTLADGASASLTGHAVTANQVDFPGALYVQEPSGSGRFGGIRVQYSGAARDRGDVVDVSGTMATGADGEREIDAGTNGVDFVEQGTAAGPLGMTNRLLGGNDFNIYTSGVNYPPGVGLYNKGLLVKAWGKVSAVDSDNKFFYIDDGTGYQDGSGSTGVKVSWAWPTAGKAGIVPPHVGWYVSVIGLSGSESVGSNIIRVLRLRSQSDLTLHSPQDTSAPSIAITSPPDGEIHKDRLQTAVQIAGTASDVDTCIVSVEVAVVPGFNASEPAHPWSTAYIDSSLTWTFNWSGVQAGSYTIWASATDFAGNTSAVSRNVTVTDVDVIYVSPNGNNTTGASWSTAKTTVAGGLAAASSGKEVWVARGLYIERITLKSAVALYGGFSDSETFRERRNWATNVTVLDGGHLGSVVSVPSGATSATSIDGFTIRNGTASSGGGIFCYATSATIANNVITGNTASGLGGGVYSYSGSVGITNNVIRDNTAGSGGGGVYYWRYVNDDCKLISNTIVRNSSPSGGGIYFGNSATLVAVANNIVAYNAGGGISSSSSGPGWQSNYVYGNAGYDYTSIARPAADLQPTGEPRFACIEAGDVHLLSGSPCIDAGIDVTSVPQPILYEMDGTPRKCGNGVDVGADEWTGTDPAAPTLPIIYVKPDGDDNVTTNPGRSWTTAVKTVQKGIDLAGAAGFGEVWVAGGTYNVPAGKTHVADMKWFVKVYGGFAVNDTSKSARNWKSRPTILSGTSSGFAVNMNGVVGCALDGFTIRNGCGGICCSTASATIVNNVIRENIPRSSHGGGLSASNSTLTVAGNVFVHNVPAYSSILHLPGHR